MKKKVWLAFFLAALMALTACGAKTPEQVFEKASKNLQKVQSFSYLMNLQMELSIMEQPLNMDITMDADCVQDPLTMQMDMNMDMGELGTSSASMYLQAAEDGAYTLYTGADDGSGNLVWSKQEIEDMEQYDEIGTMDTYLTSMVNLTEIGTETRNGEEVTRYDGVVTGEAMQEALQSAGVVEQLMGSLGLNEESAQEMLDSIGELPVSLWIAKKTCLPVRYEMDLTGIMQTILQPTLDEATQNGMAMELGSVLVSLELSNFDSVTGITIPEEAMAAENAA